ncbi:MAG TPA: hypothetical protein VJ204_10130 [Solirubrobacterales bacterium]|nr:hypothetical protein [Solirubrobacterales bacterium]
MKGPLGTRIWSYRDAPAVHLAVGALVCLFVLSPALFTPWGFGPDYYNHLWLVWQQSQAISAHGHPTFYMQQASGIFEPFYTFYGGTLYATAGAASAIIGGHTYLVFVASIAAAVALAYGGLWWLGRLLGLGRWQAHLPAFVFVTAAYYLTDLYARGAWPEIVALSAVPMFVAAGVRLLTGPWRPFPVLAFVIATVFLTGSHNITLLWTVVVVGPVAVVVLLASRSQRPSFRALAATAGLALVSIGINAWYLLLDLSHSGDTLAGSPVAGMAWQVTSYYDKLGVIFDPLRQTPSQSNTAGLTIAAPLAALVLSVVIVALVWPVARRVGAWFWSLWAILLATIAGVVVLMTMPEGWWNTLGSPFILIQYPYRLAGWLALAIALQLAVSLRLARELTGAKYKLVIGLAVALVLVGVGQAAAQMFTSERVDGKGFTAKTHASDLAYANGPTTPPFTWYDRHSYADHSLPLVEVPAARTVTLPTPSPGQTRLVAELRLPPGHAPVATNVAGGPFVAKVEGIKVIGRTLEGMLVVSPPADGSRRARVTVRADAGGPAAVGLAITIVCLLIVLALLVALTIRPRLRYRRDPAAG